MVTPHTFKVRIYFEDTDIAGVVYYANYLKFAERARTEMLREYGIENRALIEKEDKTLVVRRCEIDYKKGAHLDDYLTIETSVESLTGARVVLLQDIKKGTLSLATLKVTIAAINSQSLPTRLPESLKKICR